LGGKFDLVSVRPALVVGLVGLLGLSLFGGSAAAGSGDATTAVPLRIHGEYQLEFGFAKRAIARETAAACANIEGCANWSVSPCKRQSWHRVDCLSNLHGENGVTCSFVTLAVWPPWSNHLLIRHKRIHCLSLA
jgi:hypothetical protein